MSTGNYFEQYSSATSEGRQKYGPRTIVWMEVGSFFEMYAIPNPICSGHLSEGELREMCSILDITVTKKNKSVSECDAKNPYMAGFPSYMLDKYIDTVVDHGYTIVLMEQQKTKVKRGGPNGKETQLIYRSISRVISPGTHIPESPEIGSAEKSTSRYLMTIYVEEMRRNRQAKSVPVGPGCGELVYGIAVVDITTGDVNVHEVQLNSEGETMSDHRLVKEDLYRVLMMYGPPNEVYLMSRQAHPDLVAYIGEVCGRRVLIHDHTGSSCVGLMCKVDYQNTMFRKVYPDVCRDTMLSPVELLDLERRPLVSVALCGLFQYVYDHGEHLMRRLKVPSSSRSMNQSVLMLNYTSAQQLDVCPVSGGGGLIGMFNRCQTVMGRRLFRNRLLSPMVNAESIQSSYNSIKAMLAGQLYNEVFRELQVASLPDLDRLTRKLHIGRITSTDLLTLCRGIKCGMDLVSRYSHCCSCVHPDSSRLIEVTLNVLQSGLLSRVEGMFVPSDQQSSVACSCGDVIVKPGVSADVDRLSECIKEATESCQEYARDLNIFVQRNISSSANGTISTTNYYKLESNEKEGYYLNVTQKRHQEVSSLISKKYSLERVAGSSSVSNVLRLTSEALRATNQRLLESRLELQERSRALFADLVRDLGESSEIANSIRHLVEMVSHIDFYCTCARLSCKYGWSCPEVQGDPNEDDTCASFVEAKQLRHPIIENLLAQNGSHAYVPNDVCLGCECQHDGMLLYGINASGKSSLMKSVGLAVIMAQAGMYVPARQFRYRPYTAIFTRIVSMDNMYLGRSTFTNEMMELRNILRRVDHRSLVIGDELCSGTESTSAVAIVGAGLHRLSTVGCSYVFATHLHELTCPRLNVLRDITRLRVCHLGVSYDRELDSLVYHRVLKEGSGDALYGLEVCSSLDLDPEFMSYAAMIRKRIAGQGEELVSTRTSRYSARLYMDTCDMCGESMATETHHIVPQALADVSGFISGGFHKNAGYNLMRLCEDCHHKMHEGGKIGDHTTPKVMTTKGSRFSNI